jgi:hypothetical protein
MKQAFTARVFQEGNWFVAQCLEIDVASQGDRVRASQTLLTKGL